MVGSPRREGEVLGTVCPLFQPVYLVCVPRAAGDRERSPPYPGAAVWASAGSPPVSCLLAPGWSGCLVAQSPASWVLKVGPRWGTSRLSRASFTAGRFDDAWFSFHVLKTQTLKLYWSKGSD